MMIEGELSQDLPPTIRNGPGNKEARECVVRAFSMPVKREPGI